LSILCRPWREMAFRGIVLASFILTLHLLAIACDGRKISDENVSNIISIMLD
jgi:hypothetical protein